MKSAPKNPDDQSQKRDEAWVIFERQVGSLLEKFGYEVDHDTKIQGAQTDVLARSHRRTIPNLLVECKHHSAAKNKVSIDEVENFMARVIKLRMDGEVDHGYLVTNTAFTADAKASIAGSAGKYVFLVTYEELLATLLDADSYLTSKVAAYTGSDLCSRYVEQRVVDTTAVDGTIFDANSGRWNPSAARDGSEEKRRFWILPADEVAELVSRGCASVVAPHRTELNRANLEKSLAKVSASTGEMVKLQRERTEAKYQGMVEAVAIAKREYAKEIAERTNLPPSEDILVQLGENPPVFPDSLRNDIAPRKPPPALRKIWEKHLRQAQQRVPQPVESRPPPAAALLTENAAALSEESPDCETTLLSMQNALGSLNAFLADPATNLYVLLGDYGAGKTTLLQRWMWQLAEQKLNFRTDPTVRIPLLLNLREYNKVPDFNTLVRAFLADEADMKSVSLRTFRELHSSGHFVLLLDGFDEMLQRVTKPERRRCFLEIADFMTAHSKVVLAGRPGYFPDHRELLEVLDVVRKARCSEGKQSLGCSLNCLQLMDGYELDLFLKLSSTSVSVDAKRLIETNPSLHDLARRPVLTSMIMESASELAATDSKQITVRDLYQLYTDKWVRREEDKGKFRVLIDPEKKATFVRYLAMEMHLKGKLSVPFRELGRQIQEHFKLDDLEVVDHFSNDFRTCSFLTRSDDGEYRFIHKSFMEFFVALEFERGEESPFAARFNKPLIEEMKAFLTPPSQARMFQELKAVCQTLIEKVRFSKEDAIKHQNFDSAGDLRDVENALKKTAVFLDENMWTMQFAKVQAGVADHLRAVVTLEVPGLTPGERASLLEPLNPFVRSYVDEKGTP